MQPKKLLKLFFFDVLSHCNIAPVIYLKKTAKKKNALEKISFRDLKT